MRVNLLREKRRGSVSRWSWLQVRGRASELELQLEG